MFNLYNHIEELGKAHGYPNVQKLCAAAGVPRSVMSELNKGRAKNLSNRTAEKFANLLGVSVDAVLGRENMVSDEQLKAALFNGSEDVTDEMLEEVKRFAEYVKSRGTVQNR